MPMHNDHPRAAINGLRRPLKGQTTLAARLAEIEAEKAALEAAIEAISDIFADPVNGMSAADLLLALEEHRKEVLPGTQSEFATSIGIVDSSFNNLLHGKMIVRWAHVVAVCEALDVDIYLRPRAKFADRPARDVLR